jgi:hypothetical protein
MQTITVSKPESRQWRMLSGDVFLTTWANFHPRFTAFCTPMLRHCPLTGNAIVIFLIQPSTPLIPAAPPARADPEIAGLPEGCREACAAHSCVREACGPTDWGRLDVMGGCSHCSWTVDLS